MKFLRSCLTLITTAVVALSSAPASAADSLLVCQPGQPFVYPNGGLNILWNPDQGALGPLSNAEATAAVGASFDAWQNLKETSMTFQQGAPIPQDIDITNFGPVLNPTAPNGLSEIVYDANGEIFAALFGAGSGILGFAGPDFGDTAACTLIEGSSFLNGPEFTDSTVAQDIMVHEFGHYSNLGHTELNGQLVDFAEGGDNTGPTPDSTTFPVPSVIGTDIVDTMYPLYFGASVGTRTPHADDIASMARLYPAANFAATTASIRGTIFAPDGVTRLSGVNVIARNVNNPFVDAVSTFSGAYTDGTDQSDPNVGVFELNNLTPGETYAVFIDTVTAQSGRFSNPILAPLPGPEEWYSANESDQDDPASRTDITVTAGGVVTGVDIIINAPPPGSIDLGDDDFAQLFPPFPITICGQTYSSLYVNSNGSVTFGGGDTDFSESPGEMLTEFPRIAGLWDDLSPNQGGVVRFEETSNTFSVFFENVPEFFATTANSFEIKIFKRGGGTDPDRPGNRFEVIYGDIAATDGIAGFSCGGAIATGLEDETDLSGAGRRIRTAWQPAIYEQFTGATDSVDLANTRLRFRETLPFFDELENNDNFLLATIIRRLPYQTDEEFSAISEGDVDWFRFDVNGPSTIIADITNGQLDTVLGLFRLNENDELEQVAFDDDGGTGTLSRIVFEADGETPKYYVAVAARGTGRYVLNVQTIAGVPVTLGDDAFVEVPLQFGFPFQGATYSSVFVNSNGNLTFGSGDTDFSESVFELLNDQPRIAALWDDLSPNAGGLVFVDSGASSFTVTFQDVPEFFATTTNTFSITFDASGAVSITYGAIASADSIVGVSPGNGATDPGATDLSAGGLSVSGVTYEQFGFTSSTFDLEGTTVEFTP